jgi:hypothetical protein
LENDKEYFMDIIKFTCGEHDHAHGEQDFGALNRRLARIKMEYFKGTNNIVVTEFCVKIIHLIQEANLRMTANQTKTCLETIIRYGIRQNYRRDPDDPVMMDLAKHMKEFTSDQGKLGDMTFTSFCAEASRKASEIAKLISGASIYYNFSKVDSKGRKATTGITDENMTGKDKHGNHLHVEDPDHEVHHLALNEPDLTVQQRKRKRKGNQRRE